MAPAVATAQFGYLAELGPGLAPEQQFSRPLGVAVDLSGAVYVSDANNNRVQKLSVGGAYIATFGGPGSPPAAALNQPDGLAVDADNALYVADANNSRVVKFASSGRFVAAIGARSEATGMGPLDVPSGVAVGPSGDVYVTDTGSDDVAVFGADGALKRRFGRASGLADPRGIAVAPDGKVFVADEDGNRVWVFSAAGGATAVLPAAGQGGIPEPYGLGLAPDGNLWVGTNGSDAPNEGHRVLTYTPAGIFVGGFTSGHPAAAVSPVDGTTPILTSPAQVAVDCRGNVFVVDAGQNRVEKYGDPATPPPPCAPPPRSRADGFDARVTGIEITQGVQRVEPLAPFNAGPGLHQYATYNDVRLQAGGRTVVRVYADLAAGPDGGISGVPVALRGFRGSRNGPPLEPAVLLPELVPGLLTLGSGVPGDEQRGGDLGAYSFTLPAEWSRGTVAIEAEMNPEGFNPSLDECAERACRANNVADLGTSFLPTRPMTIEPVQMHHLRAANVDADPNTYFEGLRAVAPFAVDVRPFRGRVLIDDIVNRDAIQTCAPFEEAHCRDLCALVEGHPERFGFGFRCDATRAPTLDDRRTWALARVQAWAAANSNDPNVLVFGLTDNGLLIRAGLGPYRSIGAIMNGRRLFGGGPQAVAISAINRPLTAIAHEAIHALGINHASAACGGGAGGFGEPWPPDEKGFLQGVGLDRRAGPSGVMRVAYPPAPVPPGRGPKDPDAPPDQHYDLMSYCVDTSDQEFNAWLSPRNWERAFTATATGARQAAAERRAPHQAGPVLRVSGFVAGDGSAAVTAVEGLPAGARRVRAPAASPVVILGLDAAGAEVARVAAVADQATEATGLRPFVADLPARSVSAVDVLLDGRIVAARSRTATAPKIALLSPKAGQVVGRGGRASVRWRGTDADAGADLTARVEYSADGGRTFRRVFEGPDTGQAALPSGFLAATARGRVRVTVNDGLNEASVTSAVFRSLGAAPAVTILGPAAGTKMRADAALVAEGSAYDDAGRRLRGASLRWLLGGREVARGPRATILGLPAGRPRLQLVARDRMGRTAGATIRLRVQPVKPLFLLLKAPASVGARARAVRLRIASSVAATLRVGASRTRVDRTPRTVMVPVRPGRRPVVLSVRLSAGRLSTPARITVRRR